MSISIFKKLHNQKNARTFSQEYFDSMADWSYGKSVSGKEPEYVFTTPTGNKIECDSGHERKMLQHIVDHKLAIEIGGQSLRIVYSTPFRKIANYYPDIVVYTTTHHIAIIEAESAAFMSFHRDIERYHALQEYCEENGYLSFQKRGQIHGYRGGARHVHFPYTHPIMGKERACQREKA